jgi:hypothetical protein
VTRATQEHKSTLSQVPNGIELIWRLKEDLIYWMCLGVKSFALVMNGMFGVLGWIWMRWLGVFIAPNHFHSRWWRLLAMGSDSHYKMFGVRHVSATVRVRSWSTVGSFVVLLHRTVRCLLTSALLTSAQHCSALTSPQSTVGWAGSRCSAGSPDSPVAHQTVQWIIVERAL